ncbi:TIGR00266 family protein [Oscillospiraceae bacterium LCP25S3_E10]|nr:TIGR00266 family protein [Ruminococcus sp.]MDD6446896.1 TIGR00266 family protein [Ruminococcus sp.]MDY2856732.1 TIGR00266 family protein [Oscillospiraceae bacterium]
MRYNIEGGSLPIVEVNLDPNETIVTQGGGMIWMSPNLKMETSSGGLGKAFSKMFSGESIFQNRYTAMGGPGFITLASSFPGSILKFDISPNAPMVVQKSGFLASSAGVELSIFFNRKFGAGFFGGEGFIMQKLSGQGIAFVEIDGYCKQYTLGPGQQLIVDTGNLAAMDATCSMDIQKVPGVKNMLLGGEGLFNTVVTGPGRVFLQSHPISTVAAAIRPFIATN